MSFTKKGVPSDGWRHGTRPGAKDTNRTDHASLPPGRVSLRDAIPINERKLRIAVIEQAIADYRGVSRDLSAHLPPSQRQAAKRSLAEQAERWFRSEAVGPFAFRSLCEVLELEPDLLWEGIQGLRHEWSPFRRIGRAAHPVMRPEEVAVRRIGRAYRETRLAEYLRLTRAPA